MSIKQSKPLSFSGIIIYIGLDVHKKSWSVTFLVEEIHHKTMTMPPDPKVLRNYLKKHFPDAIYRSVYEAGFSGFSWHRALQALGIDNIVVNASDVPSTFKEIKTKRDDVDSLKLAQTLRGGLLRGIYIPTEAQIELRSLSRGRAILMRNVRAAKLRIQSLLRIYGVAIPSEFEGRLWTKKFEVWLRAACLSTSDGRYLLDLYIDNWLYAQAQIKALGKVLDTRMQACFGEEYGLLRTIPGVGPLTSASILTELFPMSRFSSFRKLCSFVGLIPTSRSSGDQIRIGGLTPRKNYYLMPLLIEASWRAIRTDPTLLLYYKQRAVLIGGKKAIVKVARKLLSRIRHVIVSKEAYQLSIN